MPSQGPPAGAPSGPNGVEEPSPSIAQQQPDNCFRILLATDNHIGYAEKDPIRGQDALNTFREILEIARDADVDFILLAGDLFHENRPSRGVMHQTIALLREYTLGDKPIGFELLSDPMDGATPGFSFPAVNYEDPNLNVAIPVFSIHGNHDDPQGTGPEGALCALDVLSVSGVLNYFGKLDLIADEAQPEATDLGIKIKPVLLRKGATHLAMYGVGNVRDSRMHYELRSNRVKMFMPDGGEVPEDDWFNMLLVHQNRAKHGPQSFVPEGMFDDSIKLVIWGHEHDCRIWPEKVEGKDYYITQPGSSVATSLAPGEAIPKHVGILSIQGSQFQIAEIPLKTVRPFEMDEVVLTEAVEEEGSGVNLEDKDSISAYLRGKVEELINKAKLQWQELHKDDENPGQIMLPLIRLRVETSEAKEMTNPVRFGQDFQGRVANPRDILQYFRKKKASEKKPKNAPDAPEMSDDEWDDADDPSAGTVSDRLAKLRMSNLVRQYLQAQNLEVLVEGGMEDAVMRFVDKDDRDAIKDFVAGTLKMVGRDMRGKELNEDDLEEHMTKAKEAAAVDYETHRPKQVEKKDKSKKQKDSDVDSMAEDDDVMELDDSEDDAPKAKGKKSTGKAPPRKGKTVYDDSASEEEEEIQKAPKRATKATISRAPAKAPAKKATAGKSASQSGSGRQTQLAFGRGAGGTKRSAGAALVGSDSD